MVPVNEGMLPLPVVKGKPTAGLLFVQVKFVLGNEETNWMGVVLFLLQITCGNIPVSTGTGLIITLKLMLLPEQLLEIGVTVITLAIGTVDTFIGVNGAILPIPEAGIPIEELIFVQ